MKIIHCADVHLDSKLTANLNKEQAKSRRLELLHTFVRMVDYAADNGVGAIIIAGDLFDTKNISVTARNGVYHAIADHPDIDFYYLEGNHDAGSFISSLTELPENLRLFDGGWRSYNANKTGGCNIVITGAELDKSNSSTIYNSLVLDNDSFNIVVLHGQESQYSVRDNAEVININALKNKGIDYLALGHIHSYRRIGFDRRGCFCYSGCLEGRGFDECGECGFVLLDIDEDSRTYTDEFIPFAYRYLHTRETDVTGCATSAEIASRVKAVLSEEDYEERDLVKVVLTGEVDVECEKNVEYIRQQIESGYYFVKVYDETRLAVNYDEYMLDESLKGEFVRTVMNDKTLDEVTRAEVIRCGIQALAGEDIL